MTETNYWTRRVDRRVAIRGAGLGLVGVVGAVLVGCGGGAEIAETPTPQAQSAFSGDSVPVPPPAGKVGGPGAREAGRLRGRHPDDARRDRPAGERALRRHAARPTSTRRTWTSTARSRAPSTRRWTTRRTSSCAACSARARTPYLINVEPDLAEKWEVSPDATHVHVPPPQGREVPQRRAGQRPRVHLGRREGLDRALPRRRRPEGRLGAGRQHRDARTSTR